jgi:hypothetical protein
MTNTLKFTKAPWEDNGNGLIFGQCSGDDDEAPFVADVCNSPDIYTDQERANARLIENAPELLGALLLAQEALNAAPRFRVGDTDSYRIAATVDKAIAKATAA